MHFVGIALEPPEESAHAVPAIVVIIVVTLVAAFLAINHEVLIGLRQFLERNVDVYLFPRARPQQILLRFAEFLSAKNAHRALCDAQAAIGNRFV